MASLSSSRPVYDEITREQLELLKAKFDVLQGERKVRPLAQTNGSVSR
jgi:hypothetical protein